MILAVYISYSINHAYFGQTDNLSIPLCIKLRIHTSHGKDGEPLNKYPPANLFIRGILFIKTTPTIISIGRSSSNSELYMINCPSPYSHIITRVQNFLSIRWNERSASAAFNSRMALNRASVSLSVGIIDNHDDNWFRLRAAISCCYFSVDNSEHN